MEGEHPAAEAPGAMDWRSPAAVKTLGKELFGKFKEHKVTTLAAAFAYNTVFALPALIILTVALAAVVDRATNVQVEEHLRTFVRDRAPADTKDLLNSMIDNAVAKVGGGRASLGVLVAAVLALWGGSNAVAALIEAFNLAFDAEDDRPFLKKKLLTLGLTLFLALFVNLAFVLLVFGQRIGHWIADRAGLGTVFDVLWNVLRWPAAVAALALVLAVLYNAGPNVKRPFRWLSPGVILATLLWLLATAGFGIYLRFANPGSAYGVVGAVLVLLFFLYVTGIVFLLGAELDALLGTRNKADTAQNPATEPETKPEPRVVARQRVREFT
jgi:membrane protein